MARLSQQMEQLNHRVGGAEQQSQQLSQQASQAAASAKAIVKTNMRNMFPLPGIRPAYDYESYLTFSRSGAGCKHGGSTH